MGYHGRKRMIEVKIGKAIYSLEKDEEGFFVGGKSKGSSCKLASYTNCGFEESLERFKNVIYPIMEKANEDT